LVAEHFAARRAEWNGGTPIVIMIEIERIPTERMDRSDRPEFQLTATALPSTLTFADSTTAVYHQEVSCP
jgi:hypothetical protein